MNFFIYGLAALFTLLLAVRTIQRDPDDVLHRSFARLALALGVAWMAFCLFLLFDAEVFRLVRGICSAWVPFLLSDFLTALLGAERRQYRLPGPLANPVVPWLVVVIYLGGEGLALWLGSPVWAHAVEIGLGSVVVGVLLLEGFQLAQLQAILGLPLEQARLRNLLVLLLLPAISIGLEALGRAPIAGGEPSLDVFFRAVKLQGVVPPIGALLATVSVYILSRAVMKQRMLDLDELMQAVSRGVQQVGNVGAGAATLGAVTLVQVGPSMPGHSSFQGVLALLLGLLALDPVRVWIEAQAMEWLDQRGQRLREAVQRIDGSLARVISLDGLADELLGRLVGSGRIASAALYLWDEERGAYRLIARRGLADSTGLTHVGGEPLREALPRLGAFVRPWLQLEIQAKPEKAEELSGLLRAMDGMNADAVLPLRADKTILGWLVLTDGDGAGFSEEEIARLAGLTTRATIIVENLHDFERLKEMHRLAGLGTMAAGLAHEIRNPLAGIKGAAQYLQAEEGPPDREMVQVIVDEVDRLNTVVTQFLDYARPLQLSLESTKVEHLIAQVASLFRAQGLSEVRWEEDLKPDLPAVPLDAPRIKQVLLNLCQNAVQAMKGGGSLTLRTRMGRLRDPQARGAPCLEMTVEDTGCGIAREDLDQIFVPFFTTRPDGTGLGLPICQRIIQAHHGELDVLSTVGKGTVFTIRLPMG